MIFSELEECIPVMSRVAEAAQYASVLTLLLATLVMELRRVATHVRRYISKWSELLLQFIGECVAPP